MKYTYKRKRPHTITTNDLKEMNGYFEASFKAWLEISGISESEFLNHGKSKSLELCKTEKQNEIQVSIFIGGKEIGMPLITNPDGDNKYFKMNTAFLLMFMAQKLDEVYGGEYFQGIVSEFVKSELSVKGAF